VDSLWEVSILAAAGVGAQAGIQAVGVAGRPQQFSVMNAMSAFMPS
jgi:hypothetical protein